MDWLTGTDCFRTTGHTCSRRPGYYLFEIGLNIGSIDPLGERDAAQRVRWQRLRATLPVSFLQQRGTAGRTPSIFDLNLRLDYTFGRNSATRWKPRLILDVYHLFSDGTPVDYDQIHYLNVDAEREPDLPESDVRLGQPVLAADHGAAWIRAELLGYERRGALGHADSVG